MLTFVLKEINRDTQVIFLSSISFYDAKPLVVEGEKLVQLLCKDVIILRLGGLMGYDRIAGKYSAGKVLDFNVGTNYIHRDDVVGIIKKVIAKNMRNEIFDVVAPIQSTRKEIYLKNAKTFGFKETKFLHSKKDGKALFPTKVLQLLEYTFIKKDVTTFWN